MLCGQEYTAVTGNHKRRMVLTPHCELPESMSDVRVRVRVLGLG